MAASLFGAVKPRGDVRAGALTDAIFAASLDEVVAQTAPGTYGDAETFFASTFPSGGLKTLLNEALGRLGGARPNAIRFAALRW
jgi:predicted AAA+ superfamily ATPase